jgi:hypothetical protein
MSDSLVFISSLDDEDEVFFRLSMNARKHQCIVIMKYRGFDEYQLVQSALILFNE